MEKYTYHLRGGCASRIAEMTCIDQCNTFDWGNIKMPKIVGVMYEIRNVVMGFLHNLKLRGI